MRIIAIAAVLAARVVLSVPGRAQAAQGCTTAAADDAATAQLLPYADRHAPRFFGQYGGAAALRYERGTLLCRALTGDGDREMIVRLLCCTGGSPSPWAIFRHDANGAWRLAYAPANETVFRPGGGGRGVAAKMAGAY